MNNSKFLISTLVQTMQNKMLGKATLRYFLLGLGVLGNLYLATPAIANCTLAIELTTHQLVETKGKQLDSIPRFAPEYAILTSKGIERTAADFQNYYLQVIAAKNYAAIQDELTYYKTFVDTYLGERPDNAPYKVFIGPFPTRADARIYKRNNPDLVPSDAFPLPAHTVEPIIQQTFRLRD